MPQLFQVLCCYSCEMFQVHQVKKSIKWNCRGCNAKQSLKKAFKIGPARECRYLVQELNMRKCGFIQDSNENSENLMPEDNMLNASFEESSQSERTGQFLNEENEYSGSENMNFLDDTEFDKEEDNKYLSDFSQEVFEESFSVSEDNSLCLSKSDSTPENCDAKNLSSSKASCTLIQSGQMNNNTDNYRSSQKRCFESDKTEREIVPPVKKNRGFQMILKAASKLS